MRLPKDAFIELDPVITDRGRKLRRFKIKALEPNGPVYTEVDPDEGMFKVQVLERKPLPLPEFGYWAKREEQKAEEDAAVYRALGPKEA